MVNLKRALMSLLAISLAVFGLTAPAQAEAPSRASVAPHGVPYQPTARKQAQTMLSGGYKYAGGSHRPGSTKDGAWANITVAKPYTASGDHSLVELSAQGGPTDRELIVEVGWVVDPAFGDSDPHLFASRWVNNVWAGCYFEGCGWVDATPSVTTDDLGLNLASVASAASPGNIKKFAVQWFSGNWWVSYDNVWIGYWSDDLWQFASPAVAQYNSASFFQAFGEVWSNTGTSCTDMGNGLMSSNTNAAGVFSWAYLPAGTYPASSWGIQDHPSEYTATALSGRSGRLGGPGPC